MALWCHREPKAYVYDYLHVQGQKERQEDKGLLTTEILSFYSGKKPPFLYLSLNVSFPIPAPPSRLDLIACTEYKDTCPLFKQSLVNGREKRIFDWQPSTFISGLAWKVNPPRFQVISTRYQKNQSSVYRVAWGGGVW